MGPFCVEKINTERIFQMKENENRILSLEEMMPDTDYLVSLIEARNYAGFKYEVEKFPPADIAEMFGEIPEKYRGGFYRLLPKELASEVFVELSSELQEELIATFTDTELSVVLNELYLDDTVDIIEEMPASVVKRIIKASNSENREEINRLLRYPADSAGTIMTTEYVRFTESMTVEAALAHIRSVAIDKETIYTCYITDDKKHLMGIVTAKELLISDLKTRLGDIMEPSVIFVNTTDDKEEAAMKFRKYGFLALPVVDNESRLVGIITVDDAIEVIGEETEEDFAKMAAIIPSETPYLKTTAFTIWKQRIPWLLLLMISATFSSVILGVFEAALPAVLVIFVPMLMDTGGNSGAQTSVTIIRGLSVGEVKPKDIPRILFKEFRIGLYCALTLSVVAFGKIMLVDRLIMHNESVSLLVGFIVALSLGLTIIMAKLIGASLPIAAKLIGFDPAVMASPLITTVVDALSLLLYFFISKSFLPIGL